MAPTSGAALDGLREFVHLRVGLRAEHFLSRLDRLSRADVDLALELYRDQDLPRFVLTEASCGCERRRTSRAGHVGLWVGLRRRRRVGRPAAVDEAGAAVRACAQNRTRARKQTLR
jgi:hypothetical protein